jgi:integrase
MQLSLVTLQAEQEICWMQREHIRDGYLYVVRQKTAAESDAAFIRIRMNPEIERVLKMSRQSKIVSPFFVHRIRRSVSPHQKYVSPHPTFVRPQALSEEYRIARDRAKVSERYAAGEAPTFHEIRSLGARLMREQGVSEDVISALLAHGKRSTTEIYLDGRDVVPDDRYIEVEATLVLKRV